MPAEVVAAIIGATARGVTGIYAAKKESGAATQAATLQTQAATRAAELQQQSTAQALAFQKAQAAQDQANYQATQYANYGQYLNQQARLAPYRGYSQGAMTKLGGLLGVDPAMVPPPPPPPMFSQMADPIRGAQTQAASDPAYLRQQVTQTLAAHGVNPTGRGTGPGDVDYWVDVIARNGGWNNYWPGRIGQEVTRAGFGRPVPTGMTAASQLPRVVPMPAASVPLDPRYATYPV